MDFLFDDRLPHRFVLVVGALFGVSVVFLMPPFSAPDELAHFLRAYHCSQGKVYAKKILDTAGREATGDDLPASLLETYAAITHFAVNDAGYSINWNRWDAAADIPLEPRRQDFFAFGNTAMYTPLPYLPQAAAMAVARQFEMRPLYLLYLGRLANMAAYLCLVVAAVRIMPLQKWTLALVALIPMSVYMASSLSADAMTIGLAMLFFAATLDAAIREGPASRRRLFTLGLLLVLLGLSKQAYLGLGLLVLAIPADKFTSTRRRLLAVGLLLAVPLAIVAAWGYSVRDIYVPILPFVKPREQALWILHHPGAYFSICFKQMYDTETYLISMGIFGWLGRPLWKTTLQSFWVALFATAVLDGGKPRSLALPMRLIVFGTFIAASALMETLVFLSSEPVGQKNIPGMQPRYLLPLLPLLFLSVRGPTSLVEAAAMIPRRFQSFLLSRHGAATVAGHVARVAVPLIATTMALIGMGSTWWNLVKRYYW